MDYSEKNKFHDPRTVQLASYCPGGSLELIDRWLSQRRVALHITRDRLTKVGDFRPGRNGQAPAISLNYNLHPVEFLVTLAHELAHYDVYAKYARSRAPHGPEWKQRFRELLREVVDAGFLDQRISDALIRCYFLRERIASSVCQEMKDLLEAGQADKEWRVRDVAEGHEFMLRNGKRFVKGPRMRTRYRCREVESGRTFTVHPMALVVKNEQ